MNEKQAIEFASEHAIPVGVDRVRRIKVKGSWTREFSFTVGNLTVKRRLGEDTWQALGRSERFKRGEAIEKCVRHLLNAESDQSE
jgi:hypothetical protein